MTIKRLILLLLTQSLWAVAFSQTVVSGKVFDRQTGQPLPHVSVTIEGEKVHTVTNDDGYFLLKTNTRPQSLRLSHIGYKSRYHQLDNSSSENIRIMMTPTPVALREVIVSADDPVKIVMAAISRIKENYPKEPELVRCFYRETARRGSRFISVAEAVMDMYKTGYSIHPDFDAVGILKGRRLMSLKARDTLGVKIQGGPVIPLMVDVAKNPDYLLNREHLSHCVMHMELPVRIGDRLHYVVRVTPQPSTPYAMIGGLLYIDSETLAFSRAEVQLDMDDWFRASEYMLVHKPFGLRFRPKELSITVVYETDAQGITHMKYMRNEMRFTCDWKRRLFAAPFTTVSEMVVTDQLCEGYAAKRPKGRSSFGIKERFYDKVEYFEDPDFWADYNIIEPTESLEHAIGRLKKKVRSSTGL